MKKVYYLLFLYGISFYSCKQREDYFAGEITIIDGFEKEYTLQGEEIKLDGIYAEYMSVYDSLMLFCSATFPDYRLYVYNLNTGKQLKSLFKTGRGANEFIFINHYEQFIKDSSGIKLWFCCERTSHMLVNLTRSLNLDSDSLVIDSVIPIEKRKITTGFISYVYALEDHLFLTKTQCEKAYYKDIKYIPGKYSLFRSTLDYPQKHFVLFNKPIMTKEEGLTKDFYYTSDDRLKPDKSKIAMAMYQMSQLNILDIKTGELKGFRLKGTPGFEYLTGSASSMRTYYDEINVDDQYIYAIYEDKWAFNNKEPEPTNTIIHVYDWNGNAVCKLIMNQKLKQIALDPVSGFLYGKTGMEEIFRYDVKSVLPKTNDTL